MDSGLQASLPGKLAAWCVLYGVGMCFVALRIFARLHVFGSLTVDDWLMVAAGVAYTMSMITEIFIYLSLRDLNVVGYIKSAFALYFVVVLTMWLIKFSVWCFMKRLMHGKWMNRFANAVFVVLVLSFVALNVFNLSWCAPISSVWDLAPGGCVYRIEAIIIFDGVINTFTDILLMILPLPLIWRVRLPLTTKLSLTGLFSLGFVVIAANIVSSWIGSQKNFISGANFTIWCNISLTAAATVACAPQIRTLFLKRFRQLKSQQALAPDSVPTEETPESNLTAENRSKSTPLMISNKFLRGDGKVGVGDVRLQHSGDGELGQGLA